MSAQWIKNKHVWISFLPTGRLADRLAATGSPARELSKGRITSPSGGRRPRRFCSRRTLFHGRGSGIQPTGASQCARGSRRFRFHGIEAPQPESRAASVGDDDRHSTTPGFKFFPSVA